MKKNFFIALAALMICGSCSDESYLPGNEKELADLNGEYETMKYHTEKFEGEDDLEKIETSADEATIKASMDEYVTELMNRTATAKERVMRSAYNATTNVVGIFKVASCGNYKELTLTLDCEDTKENSHSTGNIGASSVTSNGNVMLRFCLATADRYYPGGVFLVDHIRYGVGFTDGGYHYQKRDLDIFVRHHDSDDKNPDNSVVSGDERFDSKQKIKGYSKIDDNATLAWGFPQQLTAFTLGNYHGPDQNIAYGLLTPIPAATGTIYCDDEDSSNANWIKKYNASGIQDKGFTASNAKDQYGVIANSGTTYSISISTDPRFSNSNRYYWKPLVWY